MAGSRGSSGEEVKEARLDELKRRVAELARQLEEGDDAVPEVHNLHDRRAWFVFDLMVSGSFVPGRTHRWLAKQWGLSMSYVRQVTVSASLLYKTFYATDEQSLELLRLRVMGSFDAMAADARAMAAEHGPYALKVSGELLANMALYAGLGNPGDDDGKGNEGPEPRVGPVLILPPKDPLPASQVEAQPESGA